MEIRVIKTNEDGSIPKEIMDELNEMGKHYHDAVYNSVLEDSTERIKFLFDEWWFSRGPNGGSVYSNSSPDELYDKEIVNGSIHVKLKPGKKALTFEEQCYAHEKYADYTWDEKYSAYCRSMEATSRGCG